MGSTTKIKKIDPSQIRYTPKEGEVIQNQDGDYLIWKDGSWMKINMDSSGINVGLYDMNKQIIAQLPVLTDLEDRKHIINSLHNNCNNEFYMLYGKEISYFTLFRMVKSDYFADEVIACLNNIGDIKAIDFTEAQDAVEIWVHSEDDPTCLYLFPYDSGLVTVGV